MPGEIRSLSTTHDVNRIEAPVTWKAYLICAFASFGGIFFGYDSGYINGVNGSKEFIRVIEGPGHDKLLSSHQSLIVSILSCGTFFGAIIAGDVADIIGRKWTVIMGCVIYAAGVVIQMGTGPGHGLGVIVTGRLIAGFGVGFESAVVILYMSEIVSLLDTDGPTTSLQLTEYSTVPQKGSRRPGGWLPILHHHRSAPGRLRHVRDGRPHKHRRLPYPYCHPVHLGHDSRWRSGLPARLASVLCKARQDPESYQFSVSTPWRACRLGVHTSRTCRDHRQRRI